MIVKIARCADDHIIIHDIFSNYRRIVPLSQLPTRVRTMLRGHTSLYFHASHSDHKLALHDPVPKQPW